MSVRTARALDLSELERVFQAPARLRIMAALMARQEMDFNDILELLQLTRGNLSMHMKTLAEANYIGITKEFKRNRPHTSYGITELGKAAFSMHVSILEGIIASANPEDHT